MAEKIVWTVLPNGFDAQGRPRVSIVMSPRLTPDPGHENEQALLSGWPDFLDWPATLAGIDFTLDIDGHDMKLKLVSSAESALWTRLFTPEMRVAPFVFADMSRHNLHSFPVRHMARFLKDHYGNLAAQQGLDRPALFPIGKSPLGPMIRAAAGGERYRGSEGYRKYDRYVAYDRPRATGIDHLLVGGEVDSEVCKAYFGEYSRQIPRRMIGLNGQVVANRQGIPSRALPADLPASVSAYFGDSQAAYTLYQANRFYSRPETDLPAYREMPDPAAARSEPTPPTYDFHKVVASFGEAPDLMRRLGLVIDAVLVDARDLIEPAKAGGAAGVHGFMQVKLKWGRGTSAQDTTPHTAWRMTAQRFVTRSRDGDSNLHDGLLALRAAGEVERSGNQSKVAYSASPSPFNVVQVDVDGSAVKIVNFVNSALTLLQDTDHPNESDALSQPGAVTYTTNDNHEAVPALRSGGLTITRNDRARDLASHLASTSLKNGALDDPDKAGKVVLFSEDVLRGYRVDVHEKRSGQWRSLCARIASYRATSDRGPLGDPVHDEGFVQATSTTTQADPDDVDNNQGTQDHYLHEALFKWTGWSLVAPRPGRRIVAVNEHGLIQEEVVKEQTDDDLATGASPVLTTTLAEPGTLPRLRFGETYRLRARSVDLAGNSFALDEPSLGETEQATDAVTYRRLEPVDPPALTLAGRLSEGESPERAVIRSDVIKTDSGYQSLSTTEYLQRQPYADNEPDKSGFAYVDTNRRHLVPPKGAQALAELHGSFDEAFDAADTAAGPASIKQAYELITTREAGTLYDGGASVKLITPPVNGASTEEALKSAPPEGFRLQPGQYVAHTEAHLKTPYLPDPAAAAVVLRGVPGLTAPAMLDAGDGVFAFVVPFTKEVALYVPLKGDWPDYDGFRIDIAELPETIDAVSCSDDIDTSHALPHWDSTHRVLTIFLRKGEIAPLRYSSPIRFDTIANMALPAWASNRNEAIRIALSGICGTNWMLNPDRTLTLVHATQHPVCEPAFLRISAARDMGDTYMDLGRETFVRYHARSTGQLEVAAEWMEWVDEPDSDQPPYRRHMTARLAPVSLVQPGITENEPHKADYAVLGPQPEPGKARPQVRHEFGDRKFRFIRYNLVATTRFREYLPPVITADPAAITRQGPICQQDALVLPANYYDETVEATDTACGAPLLRSEESPQALVVPASGRPQPPHVVYIVPTQHWTDTTRDGFEQVVREDGTLRIYLERPWFTSGEGELLGVIVAESPPSAFPLADLGEGSGEDHVSQWGLDPLFDSALPHGTLTAAAFPEAVYTHNVELPEVDRYVTVAGHRVYFDAERNQWFADIRVNAGASYMPFVRLSLARFQPWALYEAHLSIPVQAPFAQLLPRRRIDVKRSGNRYCFSVYGPVPEQGAASSQGLYPDVTPLLRAIFGPGPGHNRIEVVLQQQDTSYATDLDWFDVADAKHPSGDATPRQASTDLLHEVGALSLTDFVHAELPSAIGTTLQNVRGQTDATQPATSTRQPATESASLLDIAGVQRVDVAGYQRTHLTPEFLDQMVTFETCVWRGCIDIPENLRGKRLRLMLREYERHFSDDEVTAQGSGRLNFGSFKTQPKVVERLVFAREFTVASDD